MYNINGDNMFNTEITSKIYQLKELLVNCKEYKDVKEKERLMEDNCSELLIKYSNLINEYNQALRFKDYGSDIKTKQIELNKIKIQLDNNEYVRSYKKAYKTMVKLLEKIEDIIFEKIIERKRIYIE